MLNSEQIKTAIVDNEIDIFYSFYQKENGELALFEAEKSFLDSPYISNLYSDRLKLTMGPVVKVIDKQYFNPKRRFKNTDDCIDLRKTNNAYKIRPKESIVILTNERVRLSAQYSAIILPRISLSDVGIVVTAAYIDPFYNGLLRLHVTNHSDSPYELKALESIAQCFFFKFSAPVDENFKHSFAQKSVFYGQNWNSIIKDDRAPFPVKKSAILSSKTLDNLKYQWGIITSFIKKHSIIFMIIMNLSVLYTGYLAFSESVTNYTSLTDQLVENFQPASTEIVINSGDTYGEKMITVPYGKADILAVLCNNDSVEYRIESGNISQESTIVFSYTQNVEQAGPQEINFSYLVLRRIND